MPVTIYHNPRCSKSRKTLELLIQQQQQPEIVEYLKDPPNAETIRQLLKMLGISARELLRDKEPEYAAAGLANESLSEDQIIAAMVEYPKLIERPVVVIGNQAVIGRPPERVLELIGRSDA